MNERYRGKIRQKTRTGDWRENDFKFTHRDFQNYLNALDDPTQTTAGRDNGRIRETIVSDVYRIKGYRVVKLKRITLRDKKEKIPDPLIDSIEYKLGDDLEIDDLSKSGIPDLLVYKLADWHDLTQKLPPIENIKFEDEEIMVKTEAEGVPNRILLKDWQFVEVKSWTDRLNENQSEWFDEFGQCLDARVFRIKHLGELDQDIDSIDVENPWRKEQGGGSDE